MSDLAMVSWVLVVVAQAWRGWENSYDGQIAEWAGKIGGYYTEEAYRRHLEWWAAKGMEAAKRGEQC